jgi:hypothetical protein
VSQVCSATHVGICVTLHLLYPRAAGSTLLHHQHALCRMGRLPGALVLSNRNCAAVRLFGNRDLLARRLAWGPACVHPFGAMSSQSIKRSDKRNHACKWLRYWDRGVVNASCQPTTSCAEERKACKSQVLLLAEVLRFSPRRVCCGPTVSHYLRTINRRS